MRPGLVPVFDLDGTLLDSDDALTAPFVALGVDPEDIIFGKLLHEECERLGVSTDAYLDLYDENAAPPFPGVDDLVQGLDRWAVCSNKHPRSGPAELRRLGWEPDVALFSDAFGGRGKYLQPVLDALGLPADDVVFVGDTGHDRQCATDVGCPFVLVGWNERATPEPGDIVTATPDALARLLRGDSPIYHLALIDNWTAAQAAGEYRRSTIDQSLDEVGYIHTSFAHQVQRTADKFYRGQEVVLLEIDPQRLGADVKVEGGFPHIYGPLPVDAVTATHPVERDEDGRQVIVVRIS